MIKLQPKSSLVAIAFFSAGLALCAAAAPAAAAEVKGTPAVTKLQPKTLELVSGKQKLSITATQQKQVLAASKIKVGTGGLSFSCNAIFCACRGDADCNDMFTTNVCGPKAICIDNVCYCGRT